MNHQFTLCDGCNQEIVIEGNQKKDFSYTDNKPSPHICSATQTNHPENGTELMQNARI